MISVENVLQGEYTLSPGALASLNEIRKSRDVIEFLEVPPGQEIGIMIKLLDERGQVMTNENTATATIEMASMVKYEGKSDDSTESGPKTHGQTEGAARQELKA